MTFEDNVMAERNRQEIEAGQRRADAARARMADQADTQRDAALYQRAQKLDVTGYVNELNMRARVMEVEPMRLVGDKIDISALILTADDRYLIAACRPKIVEILEARSARVEL